MVPAGRGLTTVVAVYLGLHWPGLPRTKEAGARKCPPAQQVLPSQAGHTAMLSGLHRSTAASQACAPALGATEAFRAARSAS